MAAAEAAVGESETPGRALLRARALQSYEDPARPYVHLFDGGLSENLGLTAVLSGLRALKVDPDETVLPALRRARKVVVIAVNALRFPEVDWDRSAAPPGTGTLAGPDVVDPGRPHLPRRRRAGAREARRLAGAGRPAARSGARPTWRR